MINGLEEKLDTEYIVAEKEDLVNESREDTLIRVLEKYTQDVVDLIKAGKYHSRYSENECNYSVYK